jgi:hypothetical protein
VNLYYCLFNPCLVDCKVFQGTDEKEEERGIGEREGATGARARSGPEKEPC